MPQFDIALLVAAALLGGGVNAMVGGGTFFTFPALIEVGLSPVVANASNAVALYPGRFASVYAGRRALWTTGRARLARSSAVAALGSLAGAWILLASEERVFVALIPWLLLAATLMFAFAGRIAEWSRRLAPSPRRRALALALGLGFELLVALYGGYFGAGAAILIMAGLAFTGTGDIHRDNDLKNLLIAIITTVQVATFLAGGAIAWRETLIMLPGAIAGGLAGVWLVRRISARWLSRCVIGFGSALSLYYFVKTYW